jgi:hypothetical protein
VWLLQVDGHPVKGWDEKALLAHVMGEEGEQLRTLRKIFCGFVVGACNCWADTNCARRDVLQHGVRERGSRASDG